MTQPNRRKFRLYAPFGVIEKDGKRRYIRLTYSTVGPDGTIEKTFPGQTLDVARRRYQDLLIWGIFMGRSFRNPVDRRKPMSVELRPVPKAEQPALV